MSPRNWKKTVADLLRRASHEGTPPEEARACAARALTLLERVEDPAPAFDYSGFMPALQWLEQPSRAGTKRWVAYYCLRKFEIVKNSEGLFDLRTYLDAALETETLGYESLRAAKDAAAEMASP